MKKYILLYTILSALTSNAQVADTITTTYPGTVYSGYTTASCSGGCTYNMQVVIPPGFSISNILNSFNYRALGTCFLNQAGFKISLGSCSTKCINCDISLPGLCLYDNISIFDSLKACLPVSGCDSDTLNFTFGFYRDVDSAGTCGAPSCIMQDLAWSIKVIVDTAITGPDTVCAGLFYNYEAHIPGAVTYNWTFPAGWGILSGQGTDSIMVDADSTVGVIYVTGYDSGSKIVGTFCKTVNWGRGGPGTGAGWDVKGLLTGDCHVGFSTILSIVPNGSTCGCDSGGTCGNFYPNPNIVYAAFTSPYPPLAGYLGVVNGINAFTNPGPLPKTLYVYLVDTTFGIANMKILTEIGDTGSVAGCHGICIVNNIYVLPAPPLCNPVDSFSSSGSIICAYNCIDFLDHSTNNPTKWKWYFPGAMPSSSSQENPTNICYDSAGYYTVILVVYNNTGGDSISFANYIHVYPSPAAPIITQIGSVLHCSTDSSYISYQWYSQDTLIAGATDTLYVAPIDGNYNIVITDTNGCVITTGIIVKGVKIDVYSLNNDFSLTPNPATNQLTIHTSSFQNEAVTVSIMNVLGQDVSTPLDVHSPLSEVEVDVSKLQAGIYFLQLKSENGSIVKKFVKE